LELSPPKEAPIARKCIIIIGDERPVSLELLVLELLVLEIATIPNTCVSRLQVPVWLMAG